MVNVSRVAGLTLAAAVLSFGVVGVAHAGITDSKVSCSGKTTCVSGTNSGGGTGVEGIEKNGSGYGVLGKSSNGYAVGGFDGAGGYGVLGESSSGTGAEGYSNSGFGVTGYSSNSVGLYGVSANGNGADISGTYIGAIARSSSFPFVATDANANDLFYLDGVGNVFYHGSLNTFLRTPLGGNVTAYGAKNASPTVEDVGSGRIVNGVGTIRLDPSFAQSIDRGAAYHVFVTPGGDTRGLYVTAKTPTSFVVRETQQGRNTLDFDYRIVATPLGHVGERSHAVNAAGFGPHAALVARPKAP